MKRKQIFFTEIGKAELMEVDLHEMKEDEVLAKMEYTVVSGGTEYACLMGLKNTSQRFPTSLGYCGVGIVEEVGSLVKEVKPGDRNIIGAVCFQGKRKRG